MNLITGVVIFGCILLASAQFTDPDSSVLYNNSTSEYYVCVRCGHVFGAVAWGNYENQINKTGWAQLKIATSTAYPDSTAMYAAGFLEGFLSADQIWEFWQGYAADEFDGGLPAKSVLDFAAENDAWVRSMAKRTDEYWVHVANVLRQLDGLYAGYHYIAAPDKALTKQQFLLLNLIGDIDDLQAKLDPAKRPNWSHMSKQQIEDRMISMQHCSALVKTTADFSELYFSHNTWGSYQTMLRVYKSYDFPLSTPGTTATKVVFSSYPGVLVSDDDFYTTSAGLAVTETTNDFYNDTLYELIKPQSVLFWIRTILANRMANNGQQWMQVFERYNSGTYNNQWIIVDYKLFTPGAPLRPNTLWIGEQLPGMFVSADMTQTLAFGSWPSYNIPFFPEIFARSGYAAMEAKYGNEFSYQLCARAEIFRRDAGAVETVDQMKRFMLENDFHHDPLSQNNPANAISARHDLAQTNKKPAGGIDVKIVSAELQKQQQALAICGPTRQSLPAFSWSQFPNTVHTGQPETFEFDWILIRL
eukprot:TRINITY_DN7660_c0_g1_i1.p1 TRINITY_DN7660_c0_g1~~TRINITY_DN7660_c0_g1_i1.p1  ORF type:complete len:530 (+),score=102.91 TRINITY_DN7660_c0_g1_i1:49-1638(+)